MSDDTKSDRRPFSQRHGLVPTRTDLQVDFIDRELRTRLYNAFYEHFVEAVTTDGFWTINPVHVHIWTEHLVQRRDLIGQNAFLSVVLERFTKGAWYEVYDLVEFSALLDESFLRDVNRVLEAQFAGYRFVGTRLVPITSPDEIGAIETALAASTATGTLSGVREHLEAALDLFANRSKPDYRNAIKEAISAVEYLARKLVGQPTTLGDALKRIASTGTVDIHPALKGAFSQLYGWTSDGSGIRHALTDQAADITPEDARFMIVACSAFVNYLIAKAHKTGVAF